MALRFLLQSITPVERMTASLGFRHVSGAAKASSPGAVGGAALPERPRKPSTGYVRFVTDTIPKLKETMPGVKSSDLMVKASALWKDLDATTRKRYNDEYTVSKDKWMAAMARFEASLSPAARDQLMAAERRARDERREGREKRQRKKQLTEHHKPRRPANAFMLFIVDKQKMRGDRNQKEFVTDMSKEWSSKSEADKAPYVRQYTQAKEQYEKELAAWERQMIRQGRADLVRTASQPAIESDEPRKARR